MSSPPEFDLDYTCVNAASVNKFDDVMSAYLGARANVPDLLSTLIEDEPDMPMAICLQGYLLKLAAHPKLGANLQAFLSRANNLTEINPREALHVQALNAWAEHRDGDALQHLEAILAEYPADTCALRVAHYLHFYRGNGEMMAASTARVASAYDEHSKHYGYYLGMHAFGLEESGQLDQAEAIGRQAATLNPADLWAVHAVAHALYSKEEYDAGIDWLRKHEEHWQGTNNFRYHLYWHIALYYLQQKDYESALAIYDAELEKSLSDDFYLDVCNNASLLWRLEYRGVDVGDRWHDIAEIAQQHTDDQELVFASLHYLLALHRTDSSELAKAHASLTNWSEQNNDQGLVCEKVGLPVWSALANGHREALNSRLSNSRSSNSRSSNSRSSNSRPSKSRPWQDDLYLVGGSHAQRELFTEL